MTLAGMPREIERVDGAKHDFIADTRALGLTDDLQLRVEGNGAFGVRGVAHEQIGARLSIPRKYYQRMQEDAPDLLAANVNRWFQQTPERRLVRTLDGGARAFLSDRFRPLDHMVVAKAALPVLQGEPGINIRSCALSERRLYLQAVTARVQREVRVGDPVQAGVMISNSEVGCGSVRVEPLIFRLACLNGMIRETSLNKYHVGRKLAEGEDGSVAAYFQTDTVRADEEAFSLKVRDTVKFAFDEGRFEQEVLALRAATEDEVEATQVVPMVEEVTKTFDLTQAEGEGVLSAMIKEGDLTRYGLANAMTFQAHGAEPDRAVDFERLGSRVIELKPSEWKRLSTVAA